MMSMNMITIPAAPYGSMSVLFRRWRLFFAIFALILTAEAGYLLFTVPKYESAAELVVTFGQRTTPEVDRTATIQLTPSDRHEIVLSHAAILESVDLAQATIEAFGLATVYPDIAEDPPSQGTPMDAAVKQFRKDLWVSVGSQDNIISVSILHPDIQLAPRLVAKLIELYIARQTHLYRNSHPTFVATQVEKAHADVDAAQASLERFKSRWRISDYDQEVQSLLRQRGDVDSSLNTAKANRDQAVLRQRELQHSLDHIPRILPESANSEKYRALDEAQSRLDTLRSKQSQMLATYRANGPAMASLNAGVERAEADVEARRAELKTRSISTPNVVHQTLQTDYLRTSAEAQSAEKPVQVLSAQLAAIDERLKVLQTNHGQYSDLLRKNQIADETYHTLSIQFADAQLKDQLNRDRISPAVVISEPTHPYKAVRPRKLVSLLASLIGGVILAYGAVLLREATDDRFATAEQVAALLDIPVLASFPHQPHHIPLEYLGFGDPK